MIRKVQKEQSELAAGGAQSICNTRRFAGSLCNPWQRRRPPDPNSFSTGHWSAPIKATNPVRHLLPRGPCFSDWEACAGSLAARDKRGQSSCARSHGKFCLQADNHELAFGEETLHSVRTLRSPMWKSGLSELLS